MPAPTNITALTATALTLPASVTQDAHDAGTTYPLWFSFVAPTDTVVAGAFGFGDLSAYFVRTKPYDGPAAAPTQILSISATNKPIQFPVTAGTTYYVECAATAGNPTPAILTLHVQVAPNEAVPINSIAVNDDTTGFPLTVLSSTVDHTVLKYVSPFPSGEGGDVLANGTICVEDSTTHKAHILNSAYQEVTTHTFTTAFKVRTCLDPQLFYIGENTNPVKAYTIDGNGTTTLIDTLTAMTSCAALAASNDETTLYHAFTGTNQPIRTWDVGTHSAGANLVAGIVGYVVVDILVLGDDSIVVAYLKTTATRAFQVIHYDDAGMVLHTYNSFPEPSSAGAGARIAYAIADPVSFWAMIVPASASGTKIFYNVKVSDGSFLTTRTQTVFEAGVYQGAQSATPTAEFGVSVSCPLWVTRVAASPTTETFTIRRQRRFLLPSSEANKHMQIPTLELLMRTGIGLTPDAWGSDANVPQGANPQVMLRLSKDGGKTWGPERWRSAGQIGQYVNRVRWLRATGNYRNAVLEVTVSDPVDWQWLAMLAPNGVIEGSS